MEPVELEEAVRNWLRREQRKPYREFAFRGAEHDWELVGTLLCQCPFQASFVWRCRIEWYRTELSEREFGHLRVIEGPPDESWRVLSPDGTIRGAAERIRDDGLTGVCEGIDVEYIRRRARGFGEGEPATEQLTLFRRPDAETPSVADGNHYATAKALHMLDGGTYVSQSAYLAVGTAGGNDAGTETGDPDRPAR
ncbi:hypothetical protein [Halosimplex halophilum]|uniref:hypothetical protein n=1 Tax=Halosimplex halophilum TaxID=2559572 RepID=UPI00107FA0E6|nr:hypothetical protein [Halosimplex halophilum]